MAHEQSESELAHRFELRRRIGEGGMGVVYEAYDRERGRLVALKAMRRVDPVALYRFKKEFRALADIHHPNLVSIYELMTIADDWFFTMELVDGVNFIEYAYSGSRQDADDGPASLATASMPLAAALESHTDTGVTAPTLSGTPRGGSHAQRDPAGLDAARLRSALRQLAEGVFALHGSRRLHRDLKPSNVLVTREGRVVICDFGLVSQLSHEGLMTTLPDQLAGTVAYMSPEQATRLKLTDASDWYSVGVMLYEALTGGLPITGRSEEVLRRKQSEIETPPREINPDAPRDLDELCMRLLRVHPEERPTGSELLAAFGGDATTTVTESSTSSKTAPFVGRETELAQLQKAFDATRAGASMTVFLRGRSGAGRSALLKRFTTIARANANAVVLTGRCYERESVPYKAFDSLIDSLSAFLAKLPRETVEGLLPTGIAALSRLFPVLRRVPSVERPVMLGFDVRDPQEFRRRAFVALRELLAEIARQHALILCIDDLQWGDLDSGRLLLELLRPPDPPPFLFLGSYRSEDAKGSAMLELLHDPDEGVYVLGDVRELRVTPLDTDATRELAEVMLGRGDPSSVQHAELIAREAAGNPLLVGELVRYVQSGGDLENLSLANLLEFRLAKLPEGSRRVLSAVAVAGQPVELATVRRAIGGDLDIRDLVANLKLDHLVRTMGLRDVDRIETYHDRLRDVIVRKMSESELHDWHRRLATAQEELGNPDPRFLLTHWAGAGDQARAGAHAVSAAEHAESALAFDRAARLYERALSLLSVEGQEERDLRIRMADALANAGRGAEAARAYLQAIEGAKAAEQLELRRRAAEQWLHTGHFDKGLEAVSEVLKALGLRLAPTPKRALLSLVMRRTWLRLRGLGYKERDSSQLSAEEHTKLDSLWSVASGLSNIDTVRGADFQTRHLLMALRGGEPYRIARGLAMESAYSATGGGPSRERTIALIDAAAKLGERIGNPHAIGLAAGVAGVGAFLRGEWEEARSQCARGEELLRAHGTGASWELASCQFFMLGAMFYLGDLAGLARMVPERLREAVERGNLYAATGLRSWRTNVAWLAIDDPSEARRQVDLAHKQWSRTGFHLQHYYELLSNGNIDLYCGRGELALERVSERWPALESSLLMRVQNVRIEALHLRARCALAAAVTVGHESLKKTAAADAARIAKETMPWGDALSNLVLAAVDCLEDESDAAVAHLDAAIEHSSAADMGLVAAAARYRRACLRGKEDAEEARAALDELADAGARVPERIADLLAPGFP